MTGDHAARSPAMVWSLAIALGTLGLSLALSPPVPNGDGLGYLKASLSGEIYPGHVAYVPLLHWLRALLDAGPRAIDGLAIARVVSAVAGALAVLTFSRMVSAPPAAALAATVGFALSSALVTAAADVETYAPALASSLAALWCAHRRATGGGRGWWLAAAVAWAIATSMHGECVVLGLALGASLPKRDRWPALLTGGLLVGIPYGVLLARHDLAWLATATHGFHYPLHWYTPAVACYGAAKTLIHAPYPHEANWASVLVPTMIGIAVLAVGVVLGRTTDKRVALAWLGPLALVGLVFFPSDQERWLFVLPLFWLHAARMRSVAVLIMLAAIVAGTNTLVLIPHLRNARIRDVAVRMSRLLRTGDLVIGPGHGWDEYLGFFTEPTVEPFPLVYHATAGGSRQALRMRLEQAVSTTRARGARVLTARLADREDQRGWKELAAFGIDRDNVGALLPAGEQVELTDGLMELRLPH